MPGLAVHVRALVTGLLFLSCGRLLACEDPPQIPGAGRIDRLADFPSQYVDARHVEVWLPPDYDPSRRYAVLYMHDGQMLFDPTSTWNNKSWRIDRVAARLLEEGRLKDFLIVAPWNNGRLRYAEYFPDAFLPHLPDPVRQKLEREAPIEAPLGDAYLRFLVEELKPAIDARYPTRPEREHTYIMGSSMGGLISIYALLEYPHVFGAAAALSTHWIGGFERNDEFPNAALAYLSEHLPPAGDTRLYMDRGTADLDAQYDEAQRRIDSLFSSLGHSEPNYVSRVFEGASHDEISWHERLDTPLTFLLGK